MEGRDEKTKVNKRVVYQLDGAAVAEAPDRQRFVLVIMYEDLMACTDYCGIQQRRYTAQVWPL